MSDDFKKGDKVHWNSSGNEVHGHVERKLTSPMTSRATTSRP